MGVEVVERFANPPPAEVAAPTVSPTLANMFETPTVPPTLQVDKLSRDKEMVEAAHATSLKALQAEQKPCPVCPTCPPAPKCPDMSQYIRLDEVPCWNCTLP